MPTTIEWDEFLHANNRKPNVRAVTVWALDDLFWRIRYLIGVEGHIGICARDYWEFDMPTSWRRSYGQEFTFPW